MRRRPVRWAVSDVKMFWKLLVPFFLVIVVLGSVGSFLIVRFLATRAQDAFDQDLFRRAVQAEVHVFDRSLYVLDSVRLGANFEGVPASVAGRDRTALGEALLAVVAARPDLDLVVATDDRGTGIVEIARSGDSYVRREGTSWGQSPFVVEVLGDPSGDKRAGFAAAGEGIVFATAGPVEQNDRVVGAIIAGVGVSRLASEIADRVQGSVALFDADGDLLGRAGHTGEWRAPPEGGLARPVRIRGSVGGEDVATSYVRLDVAGRRLGTVAVSLPDRTTFSLVRGATGRLAVMLLAAMAAIGALGALLSRYILRRVKPLIEANRRLGHGDLGARAPLTGSDELGELARGFNAMADQLQASHEELESRVAQRTDELQRMYDRLVKVNRARAELFAMISHEFRSPLTAIIGYAETMLNPRFEPKEDDWRRRFGAIIRDSGQELLTRTNEILDLAKLESGRMELDFADVSVEQVIEDLRGTISALASQGDLTVTFDVPRRVAAVRADATRLRQIVLNIVSNAVKYTPPGGNVDVSVDMVRGRVEISVADTGVGIPKSVGKRVFDPFYQVSGTRTQKGQASSGLGLSLTKQLVEAHGGRIWYTSDEGRGTTFTFSLRTIGEGSGARVDRRVKRGRTRPAGVVKGGAR